MNVNFSAGEFSFLKQFQKNFISWNLPCSAALKKGACSGEQDHHNIQLWLLFLSSCVTFTPLPDAQHHLILNAKNPPCQLLITFKRNGSPVTPKINLKYLLKALNLLLAVSCALYRYWQSYKPVCNQVSSCLPPAAMPLANRYKCFSSSVPCSPRIDIFLM